MKRKKIPSITPSYEDEKGEYKICKGCGKKIYYDDWFKEKVAKRAQPAVLPYFWKRKKFCTKQCITNYRIKQFKHCKHCGNKYYRNKEYEKAQWNTKTMCSPECALEFGWMLRLANNIGLTYETFKKELMLIAEKYKK